MRDQKKWRGGNRSKFNSRFPRFRGQSLVFELVLLFSIAVGIFIVLFGVFNMYQGHYNAVSIEDQLNSMRSIVITNVIRLSEKEGNSSVILRIPTRIGDEFYKIELTNSGLNISTLNRNLYVFSNVYNLNETFQMSGRVISNNGQVIINKIENKITII